MTHGTDAGEARDNTVDQRSDAECLAAAIRILLHALTIRSQDTQGDGRIAFSGTELARLGHRLDHPGLMSRDIAAFFGLTPTTVQSLLDRLVRRDLVKCGKHADFGRAVALSLTAKGKQLVQAIRKQDVVNCAGVRSLNTSRHSAEPF
ncbi:MarR family winged helix-turn-helix transcriptional regulator [Litoreibacter roseus]|uniref:HTH marR-type domain-containing protein n=1 Tax=Litoreibacter roseus TaxID=2601869 RepID=A0A6N6JFF6_9RHOB|nr:hypothetical protein [Litoreibacter roseus]GFE64520.1 hypothetical protein KIN_15940 [Litoreibacter roseus]